MARIRHVGSLAAIASATGALVVLLSPVSAHASTNFVTAALTSAPGVRSVVTLALHDRSLGGRLLTDYAGSFNHSLKWYWHHGWKWQGQVDQGDQGNQGNQGNQGDQGDQGNGNAYGWHRNHGDVPEPGTFGLYLSALLGGAFFLRARKSRSR